jgi:hypothetical protein
MRKLPVLIFCTGGNKVPVTFLITFYFFNSPQKLEPTNALFFKKKPLSLIFPLHILAFTGHYQEVSSN